MSSTKIGVVIPCYRVADRLPALIGRIGAEVAHIIVVDDQCPDGSGARVIAECRDPRVEVIVHPLNRGVGAATMTGYRRALELGVDIVVKLDGDGQMPPELIPTLVAPVATGEADYTKGNRFFNPEDVRGMPFNRLLANAGLSLVTKASSGYWSIFDPANGFTAIHATVLPLLRIDRVAQRYFFETDLLFRLGLLRCKVVDVPMPALYADENSDLRLSRVAPYFVLASMRNIHKRIFYSYFLRGFSVASLYLLAGVPVLLFGLVFGALAWLQSIETDVARTSGTVMLAALSTLVGLQLILAFWAYDVSSEPDMPVHPRLRRLALGSAMLRGGPAGATDEP